MPKLGRMTENLYICPSKTVTKMSISRNFYRMSACILHFTVVPLFYFLFTLTYQPFEMQEFLSVGQGYFTNNLIFTSLILLGVMVLSRMLLYLLRNILDLNWTLYILWCALEIVVAGLFWSILLGIEWAPAVPYFSVMTTCILYLAGITVFPYIIITQAIQLHVIGMAKQAPPQDEKTLIRFHDDQKRLKFIISSPAILYIEAEDNYVHIVHLDNGKVKDYSLRSSMRALEDLLSKHGMVRCHRSYFVNPDHVELVKKDVNGYALAQLDRSGLDPVPVSKKYYDSLSALL